MKPLIIALALLPLFSHAQKGNITLSNNKSYDVMITKDNATTLHFYLLSDTTKAIKKVPKDQVLSYTKSDATIIPQNVYNITPGNALIKARTNINTGFVLSALGFSLSLIAIPTEETNFSYAGGVLSLLGSIFIITGIQNIGKAGEIMNDKKIGISFNNGIGLRYRI